MIARFPAMPLTSSLTDKDAEAAEAFAAFHLADTAEVRRWQGREYVSAATHAEIDRLFMREGMTTEEAVMPYLLPLQAKVHAAVGAAIRGQDRWIKKCFFGRLHHLAEHIHPGSRV